MMPILIGEGKEFIRIRKLERSQLQTIIKPVGKHTPNRSSFAPIIQPKDRCTIHQSEPPPFILFPLSLLIPDLQCHIHIHNLFSSSNHWLAFSPRGIAAIVSVANGSWVGMYLGIVDLDINHFLNAKAQFV